MNILLPLSGRCSPHIHAAAFVLLVLICQPSIGADSRQIELQVHAQNILVKGGLTVDQRLSALLAPGLNDSEKAWLIYRWVTHHFKHDDRLAAAIGDPERLTVDALFRAGGGSCAVFANVMHRLMQRAGLEVKTIYGLVKGGEISRRPDGKPVNHVWNAVKINQVWYLLDATWGAGYVGRNGFQREPSDLFFMVPAARAVLSHFDASDELGYQHMFEVDQRTFKNISDDATYAAAIGFDVQAILESQRNNHGAKLVGTFNAPAAGFRVINAPLNAHLNRKTYKFRIESTAYEELMILQGKSWTPMRKQGQIHSIEVLPVKGELLVMARRPKEYEFEALMAYSVK